MAQYKATFAVGTGLDKNGQSLAYRLPELKHLALKITAELFGGYSATEGRGGWIDPKGDLIEETNLVIVVFTDSHRSIVTEHARTLAITFNQTSVLLAVETVGSLDFVEQ